MDDLLLTVPVQRCCPTSLIGAQHRRSCPHYTGNPLSFERMEPLLWEGDYS